MPPLAASENVIEEPAHTVEAPLMIVPATGNGFTVTGTLATTVPQLFVTE